MPRQDSHADAESEEHQRGEIHRVLHDHVGHHPARDDAGVHPGATQCPRRHRDASRPCGGEEPDRSDAGERDLNADRPPQPAHSTAEHRAEQEYVSSDREHLGPRRARKPHGVAVLQASPRLVEPGELRQQKVERNERRDDQRPREDHPPATGTAQTGRVVAVLPPCVQHRLQRGVSRFMRRLRLAGNRRVARHRHPCTGTRVRHPSHNPRHTAIDRAHSGLGPSSAA